MSRLTDAEPGLSHLSSSLSHQLKHAARGAAVPPASLGSGRTVYVFSDQRPRGVRAVPAAHPPEFMRIIRGQYRGRRLHVPTLVLFGAEDRLIPKDAIRFHEDDAPGLKPEYVPGGAHFLVDDQPGAVAHRVAAGGHRVAAFLSA